MKTYDPRSNTPILHSKRAAVVGGGNVAMDAARCARRMGADVHVLYRRGEAELLPGWKKSITPRKKASSLTS